MGTIAPTKDQTGVKLLLAKAIYPPEGVAFFSGGLYNPWDKFLETEVFVKNQPLHINVFSGKDILTELGLGTFNADIPIDIYVGYELNGDKIFNTTPITLKYKAQ